MASVVASNVVNRVFGWVKKKNIRLVSDASLHQGERHQGERTKTSWLETTHYVIEM